MESKPLPESKHASFELPRKTRWFVFSLILILSFFSCLDMSTINTSIVDIKRDLSLTDQEFGMFSSLFFCGKIAGTLTFMFLLNICNRRYVFITVLLLYVSCLLCFVMTLPKMIIFITRIFLGFGNVFFFVYFPVWCDQFGIRKYKTLMITLVSLVMPFGSIFGSVLSTFFTWKVPIIIEISVIALVAVCLMCLSDKYFSGSIFIALSQSKIQEHGIPSVFNVVDIKDKDVKGKDDKSEKEETFANLLKTPSFVAYIFARALSFFPLMASMTYIHEYLERAMGITDKKKRLAIVSLSGLVGPTFGTFLGGTVCTLVGGYETVKARFALLVLQIICSIATIALPYMNTLIPFTLIYGSTGLFFSAVLPIITGVILTSAPHKLRATANSVNSFACNLLGQMPAPFIYGLLNQKFGANNPRAAMNMVTMASVIPAGLLVLAVILDLAKRKKNVKREPFEKDDDKGEPLKDIENKA